MRLVDAIEAWGLANRDELSSAKLRRAGQYWSALTAQDAGTEHLAFMSTADRDAVLELFPWTERSDVGALLDEVALWYRSTLDAAPTSVATSTATHQSTNDDDAATARVAQVVTAPPTAEADDVVIDLRDDQPTLTPGTRKAPPRSPEEPADDAPQPSDPEGRPVPRGRLVAMIALGCIAVGLLGYAIFGDRSGSDDSTSNVATEAAAPTSSLAVAAEPTPLPTPAPTAVPTAAPLPTPSYPPLESLAERGAVLREGKLYLQGPVPSQDDLDRLVATAAAVVGPDNVVNDYVVHPDAPTATDGTVRVEQGVFFDNESATIRPEFVPVLELGVRLMTLRPEVTVLIEGHTDNRGDAGYNRELSQQRAQAVADWIAAAGDLDPSRFEAVGFGDEQPIADNGTFEGRAQNRRITFQLFNLLSG